MENKNPEKVLLINVLSLAGNNADQMRFLEQLGTSDFEDPFCSEAFKGFCNILVSGQELDLGTLAEYFRGKVDFETLRRICLEMKVNRYINCTPETEMKLRAFVETLKMLTLDRRYKEAC